MRTNNSAARVVRVLEILARAPEGSGVTEIGRAAGIHKATASRLLGTLAAGGLVERNATTGKYRLGVGLISLAGAAMSGLDVIRQAHPVLEDLKERTRETTNLAILDQDAVLYVDQVTGEQAIVMANWVGRRSPVHCSSSGKVFLAFGEDAQRERLLRRPLDRLTRNTITDPDRLRAQLFAIRKRGFGHAVGELEEGLNTVAAPVWGDGAVVAAVSISGPAYRLPAREQPRLGRLAADAGTAIAHRMGFRGVPARS